MTVMINKITSQHNGFRSLSQKIFRLFNLSQTGSFMFLKIIQLMSESFESPSDQIGLFTFYKEQQDDDLRKKAENTRKKRHKKTRSKPKSRYQDYEKSLPTSMERKELSKDKTSDDFLRNVKGKNGKKLALTEISEKGVTNSEEEDNSDDKPFVKYSKDAKISLTPKATPSLTRKDKQTQPTNKPSQPSHQITQSQYFNERHSLNSPIITKPNPKEKILAQINSHLTKDKTHYIDPAEKQLILSRKDDFKLTQKSPLSHLLPFNERLLTIQKNQQVKVASQRQTTLKASKTTKQLHEQNKRYFNNLMESLYIRPECNQTVYRILKGTLKLPEVMRSRTHHKTEHRSPLERSKPQVRSHSFYKSGCKIAVMGRLIPERSK